MNKHLFKALLSLFLLISIWSCDSTDKKVAEKTEKDQRPNILWIIAEDLSPDLPCYGYEGVLTPTLDKLAAKGMRFETAFTTAPVCAPSRSALAVGMYQTAINAHHMRYPDELKNDLPEGVVPVTEIFRRNGYQTALFKGGPANYKTDWSFATPYTEYDASNWSEFSKDKPFFAYFNLKLTHRPFVQDTINPIDPATVKVPPYYPNHQVAKEDFADYLESLQILDQQVEYVLNGLEENGFSDNTIVIFFGDHGRPMTRAKNNLYDAGMQIPLIMAAPPSSKWASVLPKGSTNKQLVSAIDITATSLEFAGIKKPEYMHGRVLFGENKEPERTAVFCALDRIGESNYKSRAVRTDKWKYIKNYNRDKSINELATAYRQAMHPIFHLLNIYEEKGLLTPEQEALVRPMPEEELYDLENDPFEINNLISEANHADKVKELKAKLEEWQTTYPDFGMQEDSEGLKKVFAGYGVKSGAKYKERIENLEMEIRKKIEE